jgi:hypothetical protein
VQISLPRKPRFKPRNFFLSPLPSVPSTSFVTPTFYAYSIELIQNPLARSIARPSYIPFRIVKSRSAEAIHAYFP